MPDNEDYTKNHVIVAVSESIFAKCFVSVSCYVDTILMHARVKHLLIKMRHKCGGEFWSLIFSPVLGLRMGMYILNFFHQCGCHEEN